MMAKTTMNSTTCLKKEKTKISKRVKHASWLRYSQHIALLMQDKMDKMNLTQKELASQMSVSQQYVSKILKGHENFSLETLIKIEDILHINILVPEYA